MDYDLILSGGLVVDVASRRLLRLDVCIKNGIIKELSTDSAKLSAPQIVDVSGKFISPGFIDSHLHIESSLLSPVNFAVAAAKHGTTTVFVDPHEITNVVGRLGIKLFLDQADTAPLDIIIGIPSCVPATAFDDSGAVIALNDIQELVSHEKVYGLAEMMNFPAIVHNHGDYRERCDLVFAMGKIVDGHCPGLSGDELASYITNGRMDNIPRITSDHESSSFTEAIEKHRQGMYTALRYGSAEKDMDNILPGLIENRLDLSRTMLCSDDLNPVELLEQGHMDRIIRRAKVIIQENSDHDGVASAILAIALATYHPAQYFSRYFHYHNLPEIGEIAIGKQANLAVLASLEEVVIDQVFHRGELVVDRGSTLKRPVEYDYSPYLKTVNVGRLFSAADFAAPHHLSHTGARVIETTAGSLHTKATLIPVDEIARSKGKAVAKIAVVERHHATGLFSVGFVRGLEIRKGAVASTISHDSHNLIVVGADNNQMAEVTNYLINNGGGMAVAVDGEITHLPLEIGGLMSTLPIEDCVAKYRELMQAVKKTGAQSDNLFMEIAFLALPVIPELRITNRGLVDVASNSIVELFQ